MTTLDSNIIPKFVNQLVIPPAYEPTIVRDAQSNVISHDYEINVSEFQQEILPPLPDPIGQLLTTVWGYGGQVKDPLTGDIVDFRNAPGASFEAVRGIPINVQWKNDLFDVYHNLPVDPTLHWADPNDFGMQMPPFTPFPPGYPEAQIPVPIAPHLHGGENQSAYDGHPDSWFTPGEEIKGPGFVSSRYTYYNTQLPTTLWYHDHALGITRLNVIMGLAGFYLLRELVPSKDPIAPLLPGGKYEVPIVIQDRTFNNDGSFYFPSLGINPDEHPYWVPEFFGNTIMVNGKVWPNFNVEPRQYRFRILNGSNARFYKLRLTNGQTFTQIGGDGGYLPVPVELYELLIAPGERADVLLDFSKVKPNTKITLTNSAPAPFPDGTPPDPETVGQVMQFTVVVTHHAVKPKPLPSILNRIPVLTPNAPKRTLILIENMGNAGPLEVLLEGQKWSSPISEMPQIGSTEEWQIVNLTADTHPIHLHLVQFQLISRQQINIDKYLSDWMFVNGSPPLNHTTYPLSVGTYLKGKPKAPALNEIGWKDTLRMNPGDVTTIRVRYAPQNAEPTAVSPGINLYPFDPTNPDEPGYVWHCHILDHEDNEMMRPYIVIP